MWQHITRENYLERGGRKMSSGLKIWLWIVLVLNALSLVGTIIAAILAPLLFFSAIGTVLIIVGVCMILFKQKKLGFYIICGTVAIVLVFNIIGGNGIILSIISAVIMPGITYLFMKPTWDSFS